MSIIATSVPGGYVLPVIGHSDMSKPNSQNQAANQAARVARIAARQQAAAQRIAAREAKRESIFDARHPGLISRSDNTNSLDTSLNTPGQGQLTITPPRDTSDAVYSGGDVGGTVSVPENPITTASEDQAATASTANKYFLIGGIVLIVALVFLHRKPS